MTFDPTAPGSPTTIRLGGGSLESVACPLENSCTAVGNPTNNVVTFNPLAFEDRAISSPDPSNGLVAVACPSSTQCTAVDLLGQEVTFNPTAPGDSTPGAIGSGNWLQGLACPSTSQCTAVDDKGLQVTFDPTAPSGATPAVLSAGDWLWGVACPSTSQCTAVGESGEVTFDPTKAESQTLTTIGSGSPPKTVACPSLEQCTAVWGSEEVTFNPIEPPAPSAPTTAPAPTADGDNPNPATTQCGTVPGSVLRLRFRDQRITVTIPYQHDCSASGGQLNVALNSVPLERANGGGLVLSSATFYLDGGLERAHMSTEAVTDHKATVSTTGYQPNAGAGRISATVQPPVAGLTPGVHCLTIKLYYRAHTMHGHSSSQIISRTVTTKFRVR